MNWKRFAVFLLLICLFSLVLGLLMLVRRPDTITFLITGDTQGYLVPCGCRVVPAGGLARRETVLKTLGRNKKNGMVVPVEITHGFADRGPGREILNREMGNFFNRHSYLVGIGGYDLLLGKKRLNAYCGNGAECFLAGDPAFQASKEFRIGGWGFGPIGAHGACLRLVFLAGNVPGGVALPNPVEALKKEIMLHPADGYIVMGQFSPKTVGAIMKTSKRIIAIIGQWRSSVTLVPQESKDRAMLYIGDRGRRAAILKVSRIAGRWSLLPSIFYLGKIVPSEEKVKKEVAGVLVKVEQVNAEALAQMHRKPLSGGGYVGAKACGRCHAKQYDFWKKTRHASATLDLSIDHQVKNPACLECHSTGLGKEGGYPQGKTDLSGVQCEACHGPGGGHPGKIKMTKPKLDTACEACHTRRDSPSFSAEGYWQLVKH